MYVNFVKFSTCKRVKQHWVYIHKVEFTYVHELLAEHNNVWQEYIHMMQFTTLVQETACT